MNKNLCHFKDLFKLELTLFNGNVIRLVTQHEHKLLHLNGA